MSRLSQLKARLTLAWRVLRNPDVKPGRVLGRADGLADVDAAVTPASPCPKDEILVLDQGEISPGRRSGAAPAQ